MKKKLITGLFILCLTAFGIETVKGDDQAAPQENIAAVVAPPQAQPEAPLEKIGNVVPQPGQAPEKIGVVADQPPAEPDVPIEKIGNVVPEPGQSPENIGEVVLPPSETPTESTGVVATPKTQTEIYVKKTYYNNDIKETRVESIGTVVVFPPEKPTSTTPPKKRNNKKPVTPTPTVLVSPTPN